MAVQKFTVEVDLDLDDYLQDAEAVRNDVRREIICKIAQQLPLPWLVDDTAKKNLLAEINNQITHIVQEAVKNEVKVIAEGAFIPTNQWGEKKGAPTTLREMCAESGKKYFEQLVDTSGRPVDSYYNNSKMTRIEWMAQTQVAELFKSELKGVVDNVKALIQANLANRVTDEIRATVIKLLAPDLAGK